MEGKRVLVAMSGGVDSSAAGSGQHWQPITESTGAATARLVRPTAERS